MRSKGFIQSVAWVATAVVFTWVLHEFAHWAMGRLLGYPMRMSLNSAGLVEGEYRAGWHKQLISAAGPIVTLLQAALAWSLLRRRPGVVLYYFLFVPFFMRLLAAGMNVIHVNDEGRVSQALGLGTYTLPALVVLALLVPVVQVSRSRGLGARFQIGTTVAVLVFASFLILADQAWKIRLL